MAVRCEHCGRKACYYRLASGELICANCLENSVYKQVRKYLTLYNVVKRGQRAAYLVRYDKVSQCVAMLKVLLRIAKVLDLRLVALVPEHALDNVSKTLRILRSEGCKLVPYSLLYDPKALSLVEYVKLNEIILRDIIEKHELDVAFSPLFRDELSLLAFMGIATAAKHVFSEAFPLKKVRSLLIARPFYFVTLFDATALSYLHGLDELMDLSIPHSLEPHEKLITEQFYEITHGSHELLYSTRKSVEALQTYVISNATRCSMCLAYSNTDPCPSCTDLLRKSQQGLYRTSE